MGSILRKVSAIGDKTGEVSIKALNAMLRSFELIPR